MGRANLVSEPMTGELVIDGSFGEGGGQILRTSLALAAITGRRIRIEKIRAGRRNPGLAAQHLTAVWAVAKTCRAEVSGDRLGSQALTFAPTGPPLPGDYVFDVSEAREGRSAGSVTLLFQAVYLPLLLAGGDSTLVLRGGTHVTWSPPFDYLEGVFLPALSRLGLTAEMELVKWGWYPAGGGGIQAYLKGVGPPEGARLSPWTILERGRLLRVSGRAVAANLPSHIPQRMTDRARSLLKGLGVEVRIDPLRVRADSPGAGIFLTAEYENVSLGFDALGRRGLASEAVAEEAVAKLRAHHDSGAAIEAHLGDQLLLPLALAEGDSAFTVERVTPHLTTNAWVLEQFGLGRVTVEGREGKAGRVRLLGKGIGA